MSISNQLPINTNSILIKWCSNKFKSSLAPETSYLPRSKNSWFVRMRTARRFTITKVVCCSIWGLILERNLFHAHSATKSSLQMAIGKITKDDIYLSSCSNAINATLNFIDQINWKHIKINARSRIGTKLTIDRLITVSNSQLTQVNNNY